MNQLTSLTLENLACFEHLTLRPGQNTLLLGANGSGKSTLFDVIDVLSGLSDRTAKHLTALPGYQPHDGPARIRLEAVIGRRPFVYELALKRRAASPRDRHPGPGGAPWEVLNERLSRGEEVLTTYEGGRFRSKELDGAGPEASIPLAPDRSPLTSMVFRPRSPVERFKGWQNAVWLLRLEPRRMRPTAPDTLVADPWLDRSGENFVAWIRGYGPIEERLAAVVAALDGSVQGLAGLAFEPAGREHVLVARFEGGRSVDFDKLSDGQRCLIVLHAVMVLASEECSLLLLDEPDAHVTPAEIYPLFQRIRERAQRAGSQVIVASHHPQVIDLLAPDTPWELIQEQGAVRAEPFRVPRDTGVSASRHLILRGRR